MTKFKRILSVVLTAVMLFAAVPFTVNAAASQYAEAKLAYVNGSDCTDETIVKGGDVVGIDFIIHRGSSDLLSAWAIGFSVDENLTYKNTVWGTFWKTYGSCTDKGTYYQLGSVTTSSYALEEETVVTVYFDVAQNASGDLAVSTGEGQNYIGLNDNGTVNRTDISVNGCTFTVVPGVDKSALEAALNNAATKVQDQYTPSSWSQLDAAVTAGNLVLADDTASQTEVDNATLAINNAIDALVLRANKDALLSALNNAETYISQTEKYTVDSLNALQAVIDAAEIVYNDADASESAVSEQISALTAAVSNLELNKFIVRFIDYNGDLLASVEVPYGGTAVAPQSPERPADKENTYVFTGWGDTPLTNVTSSFTVTAQYSATPIDYTVTFKNYDGTLISSETYHYGDTVTVPENPSKPADETYTYVFAGWSPAVDTVQGSVDYTAQFTPVYIDYTVTFKNYDGTQISSETYHYGDTVNAPETPVKSADETYTYVFTGWGDNYSAVCNGNAEYTAQFTEKYIDYTVVFKDYDGREISSETYHYGDTVTVPADPERASDNTYTYQFSGWSVAVANVCAGNAEYTAQYDKTYIDYTVVFRNYDGTQISSAEYHYGDKVVLPENPVRESTAEHTYVFEGWSPEVKETCEGNAEYTAVFTEGYVDYTVVFKNYNGEIISSETYHYGDTVNAPETPVKPADETYTYVFTGWGDNYSEICKGNAEYTAQFSANYIDYTVVFKNYDGSVLSSETYHYGDTVNAPETPVREADNTYTYVFAGWGEDYSASCNGNAEYTAEYYSSFINYTVTFVDYNDDVISVKEDYHYGDNVTVPADPERAADNTYTYQFAGWTPEVDTVKETITYKATYTSEYINYTIVFKDYDGRIISSAEYHYGDEISIPENPVRANDDMHSYTFKGWTPAVESTCGGNAEYMAEYDSAYLAADYTEVEKAVQAANALNESDYTSVSYARVTDAVQAVKEGYTIDKQAEVNAMAKAINDAIAKLVNENAYSATYDKCAAVNNDNNIYTADSYSAFKTAFDAYGAKKDFNTAEATQTQVDSEKAILDDIYALLEASTLSIDGGLGFELSGSAIVTNSNTSASTTQLVANDGGAGVSTLRFIDENGAVIANDKQTIGTGCKVQLIQGGEVILSYDIVVYGDINGDGQVSITDIMLARKMATSADGFTALQIAAASCGTGAVTADGVIDIAKKI